MFSIYSNIEYKNESNDENRNENFSDSRCHSEGNAMFFVIVCHLRSFNNPFIGLLL